MSTQRPDLGSRAEWNPNPARRWPQDRERQERREWWRSVPRWASLAGGGALAAFGISRRSWPGAALAAGGGFLFYHGIRGRRLQPTHVEVSFTVNKPVEEVWRFWRRLENLPRFMTHLESVRPTGQRYSDWTAIAPLGGTVSWHAEITDERENQYLAWRSLPGSDIGNVGSVEFRRAPGDRGTEIQVAIDYSPPAGKVGDFVASLLGSSLEQQVREDIRHFKQVLEAGEIPGTAGQPHGRRSAVAEAASRVWREPRPTHAGLPRTA